MEATTVTVMSRKSAAPGMMPTREKALGSASTPAPNMAFRKQKNAFHAARASPMARAVVARAAPGRR